MKRLLSVVYIVSVLAAVLYFVVTRQDQIAASLSNISVYSFTGAVLLSISALVIQMLVWRSIQRSLESRGAIGMFEWLRVFMYGYLGRYIPGKVSIVIGRVLAMSAKGYSKTLVTYSSFLDSLYSLFAAAFLALLFSLYYLEKIVESFGATEIVVLSVLIVGAIAIILSPVLDYAIGALASRVRTQPEEIYTFSFKRKSMLFLASVIPHILYGLAFSLILIYASAPAGIENVLAYTCIFSFAVTASSLVIIAPSGLGVREAIIVALLAPLMTIEMAIGGAVIIRIAMLVAELLVFGVSTAKYQRIETAEP